MTWAMDNITGDQISELPEDCPKISDSFLNNSDMHMIYNLTQIAVGFLLHHELVHIKVINQHLEFSILDEESYCDKEAARIILDISDNVLLKYRGLGVAIGLLLILSHGMPTRNFDGNSHPFSYDRLIYTLSPYADPDNDVIWGFTVAILALQMTNFGIQQPIKEFDNFYECVQEYRNLLENYSSLN